MMIFINLIILSNLINLIQSQNEDSIQRLEQAIELSLDTKLQFQQENYYSQINTNIGNSYDFEDLSSLVDKELGIKSNLEQIQIQLNQNETIFNLTKQNKTSLQIQPTNDLIKQDLTPKKSLFELLKQDQHENKKEKSLFDFIQQNIDSEKKSKKDEQQSIFSAFENNNNNNSESEINGQNSTQLVNNQSFSKSDNEQTQKINLLEEKVKNLERIVENDQKIIKKNIRQENINNQENLQIKTNQSRKEKTDSSEFIKNKDDDDLEKQVQQLLGQSKNILIYQFLENQQENTPLQSIQAFKQPQTNYSNIQKSQPQQFQQEKLIKNTLPKEQIDIIKNANISQLQQLASSYLNPSQQTNSQRPQNITINQKQENILQQNQQKQFDKVQSPSQNPPQIAQETQQSHQFYENQQIPQNEEKQENKSQDGDDDLLNKANKYLGIDNTKNDQDKKPVVFQNSSMESLQAFAQSFLNPGQQEQQQQQQYQNQPQIQQQQNFIYQPKESPKQSQDFVYDPVLQKGDQINQLINQQPASEITGNPSTDTNSIIQNIMQSLNSPQT